MGAARHAVAAPRVGKPEVLVRNAKGETVSPDTPGVRGGGAEQGRQPEFKRQIPLKNSLLTSGKGLAGSCYPSAYL